MKRAIALQMAICVALFVLVVAGTARAQKKIDDCTTITEPGSYVVTKNITANPSNVTLVPGSNPPGFAPLTACILIEADFVTLDLAGFAITDSNLEATLTLGITNEVGVVRLGNYVHSGTVANFSSVGVRLFGKGHTVEHIRAVNNGASGIFVNGPRSPGNRIVGNTAISNDVGIQVVCPSVVLENAAAGNSSGDILFVGSGVCTSLENSPAP